MCCLITLIVGFQRPLPDVTGIALALLLQNHRWKISFRAGFELSAPQDTVGRNTCNGLRVAVKPVTLQTAQNHVT